MSSGSWLCLDRALDQRLKKSGRLCAKAPDVALQADCAIHQAIFDVFQRHFLADFRAKSQGRQDLNWDFTIKTEQRAGAAKGYVVDTAPSFPMAGGHAYVLSSVLVYRNYPIYPHPRDQA